MADDLDNDWKDFVSKKLSGMKYGSIQIIVHEGRIVQIEKTERFRMDETTRKKKGNS